MLLGHNSLNLLHFVGVFGVEANMLDNGSATRFHYLPLPVNFAKAYTLIGLTRDWFHSNIHIYAYLVCSQTHKSISLIGG